MCLQANSKEIYEEILSFPFFPQNANYFKTICVLLAFIIDYINGSTYKNFTFQLENGCRMVKMLLFLNINFYSEICFQKFVDSNFV